MSEEIRHLMVPDRAMFDAFAKGKPIGDWKQDELRFNEFQRGWHAALDFVNNDTISRNKP